MRKSILIIGLLVFMATTLNADSIKLADGSILQCEITGHDEKGITVKRIDNGAELKLRWEHLDAKIVEELKKQYGLVMPDFKGMIAVTGDRIECFDGLVLNGKIVSEDDSKYRIEWLDDQDEKQKALVYKRKVRNVFRNVSIPASYLMPREEVYDKLVEKYPADDANGHFILAKYCKEIDLYEKGLEHINEAVMLDSTMEKTASKLKAQLEALKNAVDFRNEMASITTMLKKGQFSEADSLLVAKEKDKKLEPELQDVVAEIRQKWNEEAQKEIVDEWYKLIKSVATQAVTGKDSTVAFTKKFAATMDKEILALLVQKYSLEDKVITNLIKNRNADNWPSIRVSFDSEIFKPSSGSSSATKFNSREIWQKVQNGELTKEDAKNMLRELMGQSQQGNKTTNNNTNKNNNDATQQKKVDPEEMWKKLTTTGRRSYLLHLYCERNKNIKKIKEKTGNRVYQAWYK